VGGDATGGYSHTFTVVAGGGYGPLSYQWKKNGANINGETDSEFTQSHLTTGDSGSYSVEISDTNGDVIESTPVTLTVAPGLPIASMGSLAALALVLAAVAGSRKRQ
jgi:hypothetical protein